MTAPTVSKVASKLVAKGLVEREYRSDDARMQRLCLTAVGCALIPVLAKLVDDHDTAFFSVVPTEDLASVEKVMRQLVTAHGIAQP